TRQRAPLRRSRRGIPAHAQPERAGSSRQNRAASMRALMPPLPLRCLREMSGQLVELAVPERLVVRNPTHHPPQWSGIEPAPDRTPSLLAPNQAGVLEDPDVLERSTQRHGMGLGQRTDRGFAGLQALEHRAPGLIGESTKGEVESIHRGQEYNT